MFRAELQMIDWLSRVFHNTDYAHFHIDVYFKITLFIFIKKYFIQFINNHLSIQVLRYVEVATSVSQRMGYKFFIVMMQILLLKVE